MARRKNLFRKKPWYTTGTVKEKFDFGSGVTPENRGPRCPLQQSARTAISVFASIANADSFPLDNCCVMIVFSPIH
jgi:hypothetical protein